MEYKIKERMQRLPYIVKIGALLGATYGALGAAVGSPAIAVASLAGFGIGGIAIHTLDKYVSKASSEDLEDKIEAEEEQHS